MRCLFHNLGNVSTFDLKFVFVDVSHFLSTDEEGMCYESQTSYLSLALLYIAQWIEKACVSLYFKRPQRVTSTIYCTPELNLNSSQPERTGIGNLSVFCLVKIKKQPQKIYILK